MSIDEKVGKSMKTKVISQVVTIKATPHAVYEALMDSKKHAEFTGSRASISRNVGGKFTAYNGYIEGENLDIIPNKKIVQSWRGSDWYRGVYSRATFTLKKVVGGTQLTFMQTGVPEDVYEDISQVWCECYWNPMKEMLER